MIKATLVIIWKIFLFLFIFNKLHAQDKSNFRIVGYYCGTTIPIDSFETNKLTHLIFSFGNLKGNKLNINSVMDSTTIKSMVKLKSAHPNLKVMLSLGGWGGCKTCSEVFSTKKGRQAFAKSVKQISTYFKTDGIDLDWEYPSIKGFPEHKYSVEDRSNFTSLVKEIRKANGDQFIISFAAGGFTEYLNNSIAWTEVIQTVDFINLMSYDLVHGYSSTSGHHTPLYSTKQQTESTDNAVQFLLKAGVPTNKIVIGAAFYGRFFQITDSNSVDLYKPCRFTHGFSWKYAEDSLSTNNGFEKYWDNAAMAPYAINKSRKLIATYDDQQSIQLKTKYAKEQHLGGIMFWQLYDDKFHNGLLEAIFENK
ncbi:MAG: glycoside hydrolase family 18 protein [Saprospiraceae bacterium]